MRPALATIALASVAAAVPAVYKASAVESFGAALSDGVKADADVYDAFLRADVVNLADDDVQVRRRQAVPEDATPDPDRNVTTPENIFVLQCGDAGFRGECLVFGAAPGKCVGYESFNSTQAFLNQYENQTTSLSTNTGGQCQFYKFRGCNNKGDDRGVTLSYNYNLGEVTEDYAGDYDNQISSWRC